MEKLKWIKASDQLPEEFEDLLVSYDGIIETASFFNGRFVITDDLEYTPEGRRTWDADGVEPLVEIKWVRMSDVLKFIESS